MHRDQVDLSYAKEASKHPVTVSGLIMAPLSNIEEHLEEGTVYWYWCWRKTTWIEEYENMTSERNIINKIYIHICMSVIYVFMYIHIWKYAHAYLLTHCIHVICMYVNIYLSTYINTYASIHTLIYAYTYWLIHTCLYTYLNAYIHIAYLQACTYSQTCIVRPLFQENKWSGMQRWSCKRGT